MLEKACCDSSVLIVFAKCERLDLLFNAFEKPLFITEQVFDEVVVNGVNKHEADAFLIQKKVNQKLIVVLKPRKVLTLPFLGFGESSVISLALEKNMTVCMDEADGRNAAKSFNLNVIGTLGILSRLVKSNSITSQQLLSILNEMINRGYRINATILEKFKKKHAP